MARFLKFWSTDCPWPTPASPSCWRIRTSAFFKETPIRLKARFMVVTRAALHEADGGRILGSLKSMPAWSGNEFRQRTRRGRIECSAADPAHEKILERYGVGPDFARSGDRSRLGQGLSGVF